MSNHRNIKIPWYFVFDSLIEGVQIINSDFQYVYVNDSVVLHAKKNRSELIRKTMNSVYPGIDQTPLYANITNCLENGIYTDIINEFTFPDGSIGFFELKIQKIDEGVLIMSVDVTSRILYQKQLEEELLKIKQIELQLLKSERHYFELFQFSPVPMWIYDIENLNYIQVNNSAINHYGYNEDEFLRMKLFDIYTKHQNQSFFRPKKSVE